MRNGSRWGYVKPKRREIRIREKEIRRKGKEIWNRYVY